MKKISKMFLCIMSLGFFAACSHTPKDGVGPELTTYKDGNAPKDVSEASREKRPLWSLDLREWKAEHGDKNKEYFVGHAQNRRTKTTATNEANLEAMSEISSAIAARITESVTKTETSSAITGKEVSPSELFEVISRKVKKKSNNLVQGTKTSDNFWWERQNESGTKLFDAWVLISLTEEQMKEATAAAARKTLAEDQAALQKVMTDLASSTKTDD